MEFLFCEKNGFAKMCLYFSYILMADEVSFQEIIVDLSSGGSVNYAINEQSLGEGWAPGWFGLNSTTAVTTYVHIDFGYQTLPWSQCGHTWLTYAINSDRHVIAGLVKEMNRVRNRRLDLYDRKPLIPCANTHTISMNNA